VNSGASFAYSMKGQPCYNLHIAYTILFACLWRLLLVKLVS